MALLLALISSSGCAERGPRFAMGGDRQYPGPVSPDAPKASPRRHQIVVAGERFDTAAPVVLWDETGGYSAYSPSAAVGAGVPFDRRFARGGVDAQELLQIKSAGWTLPMLQRRIDQVVLHYDVCGISARCFDVLHNQRGLSVHFLLDIDGTIYQTMDLKERAWHATKANDRSIGIEIANIGAYGPGTDQPLHHWYVSDSGGLYIRIPQDIRQRYGPRGGVRNATRWPLRPARSEPVRGEINGSTLHQYDLTPEQYSSLEKLIATLHQVFPSIRLDYPRGTDGGVVRRTLSDAEFATFRGVLGHWHVQANKQDPGPALDWERMITGARRGAF
jgi:N-acetyl-anhydromuramyl-L-alanine amidase AmpD